MDETPLVLTTACLSDRTFVHDYDHTVIDEWFTGNTFYRTIHIYDPTLLNRIDEQLLNEGCKYMLTYGQYRIHINKQGRRIVTKNAKRHLLLKGF